MISIMHKRHGLRLKRIWFAEKAKTDDLKGCDFVSYGALLTEPEKKLGLNYREFGTLYNDLLMNEEDILMGCKSNVRNEIRRAERDGTTTAFYTHVGTDFTTFSNLSKEIDMVYGEMCRLKNLHYSSIEKVLKDLYRSNALIISVALINNEHVTYHVYISDGLTARLTYSISLFRESKELAAVIGRANRMLHYKDMVYLKEHGHRVYDWGGYSLEKEEIKSISEFKEGFGGNPKTVFIAEKPVNLLAKIASSIIKKRG